jgi:putative tryptophan/tyrosine transport system substrate-binding protein
MSIPITEIAVRRYRPSFDTLKDRAEATLCLDRPLVIINRRSHSHLKGARLPTIYNSREYVETGGLMSYGPNWLDRWKHTAEIVDKILRGTKPAAISVEQPTKFDLVINLATAKVLDLAVPPSLLAVADEVME